MKIPCPLCSERIAYDPAHAGKTVPCPCCRKNLLIPAVTQLSAEYQEEYRSEQEKVRKRLEAERAKLEHQREREAERHKREAERAANLQKMEEYEREQEKQRQLSRQAERERRQAWDTAVTEAEGRVPEDGLVDRSYPALKALVGIYRIVAVLVGVGGLVSSLVMGTSNSQLVGPAIVVFLCAAVTVLGLILAAESIALFVNMADDIRVTKALLKRMAYNDRMPPPSPP